MSRLLSNTTYCKPLSAPRRTALIVVILCGVLIGCDHDDAVDGDQLAGLDMADDRFGEVSLREPAIGDGPPADAPEPPARLTAFEAESGRELAPPVDRAGRSVSLLQSSDVDRSVETNPAAAAFGRLIAARENPDPSAWEQAEQELERLGKAAVPVLVENLQSTDAAARELATMWLVRLGHEAENIERSLARVLDDESAFVRVNAASALSHLPAYSDRVVPSLSKLLSHPEFSVKITAATALGNAGELAAPAVPALVEALRGEEDLQVAVLMTLSRIGPAAQLAVPAIEQLNQTSESDKVKEAIADALRVIDSEKRDEPKADAEDYPAVEQNRK